MSRGQDFWARRRAGVVAEAEAEQAAVDAQALQEEHAALEEMDEAEMLAALDLPDPDTMTKGDDFSVFMTKAVPDQIRRRALRTLWRSNPVLANVDMLVDYGEDFTDAAMAVENIQTAYQVGKGMLKHVEEMARQAEERANPKEPEPPEDIEDNLDDEQGVPERDSELISVDGSTVPEVVEADESATMVAGVDTNETLICFTPRRMKFRTEEPA